MSRNSPYSASKVTWYIPAGKVSMGERAMLVYPKSFRMEAAEGSAKTGKENVVVIKDKHSKAESNVETKTFEFSLRSVLDRFICFLLALNSVL